MPTKKENEELYEAELEMQELAMQLADMLGAALYFAGAKKDMISDAVDAYLDGMDEYFNALGEDDDGEMGFEEVIAVIEHLQKTKPALFA